jgi:lysophospholipase L1-like esterase
MRPLFATSILLFLIAAPATAQSLTLGAIGDSISAGFDARHLGDNREYSWTTGSKPESQSHLKKLTALFGVPIAARNEAVAGSTVYDLGRQLDRVLAADPDFLTITVGANDVCSWNVDDDTADVVAFMDKLAEHIQRVVDHNPNVRIYLAAIPDMYNLWRLASPSASCQRKWDLFGICNVLLGSDRTEADRQAFVGRWRDGNAALQAVAALFPENVYHDPSMATTQFLWEHVSTIDCFHPSIAGQNLLSEKTWQSGWTHWLETK